MTRTAIPRTAAWPAWPLWALAVALLLVVGCSPDARKKAIEGTYASLNAASTAFVAYDAKHQAELVAAAPDRSSALVELDNYRRRRGPIVDAFVAGFRATAAAAIVNDDPSVKTMIAAAAIVAQELADLGVAIPTGGTP